MEVALARPDPDVEVADSARRDVERRLPAPRHVRVEDHGGVGPALVLADPVDDRMAADLLLAVARDADVHRQRALGGEQRGRLQQKVELALVVGDASGVEPLAPDRRLERRALPQLERRRRLDVEVAVDEHCRRGVGVRRRAQLADRQRPLAVVDELARPAGAAHERAEPLAGRPDVGLVRRVGADAGDAEPLGDLGEPGMGRAARPGI